jgi:sorbitol-specific phosphotransferase system component IIC
MFVSGVMGMRREGGQPMHQILAQFIPFVLLIILLVSALVRFVTHARQQHHA